MNLTELDALIDEIIVDANSEDGDRVSHPRWSRYCRWTTPTIPMAIPSSAPTN